MIGCGRRGTGVADAFVDATNTRMVALADLFDDQLQKARQHVGRDRQHLEGQEQ